MIVTPERVDGIRAAAARIPGPYSATLEVDFDADTTRWLADLARLCGLEPDDIVRVALHEYILDCGQGIG